MEVAAAACVTREDTFLHPELALRVQKVVQCRGRRAAHKQTVNVTEPARARICAAAAAAALIDHRPHAHRPAHTYTALLITTKLTTITYCNQCCVHTYPST